MNRRIAVGHIATAAGAALVATTMSSNASAQVSAAATPSRPEPLDRELVRKFVGAAHSDLDLVKSMLTEQPHLINATWDWGGGDFETALGGASHMARPDIARFLLDSGARMDLFCATMLGKIEIVRPCIADSPSIVQVKGPHGISLLRHAELAKHDALIMLLKSAGA